MTIPKKLDDLTPEWLSDALGRHVTAVRGEPIGVGVGLVGTLFRLTLTGDADPATMIAKLAAPTDEGRFVATILNMYGREVGFYTQLSARTPIGASRSATTPSTTRPRRTRCCSSRTCRRAARSRTSSRDATWTRRGAALRTLAKLHAALLGRPDARRPARSCCGCATTRIPVRSRSRTKRRGRGSRSSSPSR